MRFVKCNLMFYAEISNPVKRKKKISDPIWRWGMRRLRQTTVVTLVQLSFEVRISTIPWLRATGLGHYLSTCPTHTILGTKPKWPATMRQIAVEFPIQPDNRGGRLRREWGTFSAHYPTESTSKETAHTARRVQRRGKHSFKPQTVPYCNLKSTINRFFYLKKIV